MSTAGDLMRVLASVPPDAELHVYVRGTTASVQAEWVDEDRQIQNPVVLRATFELSGAAGAVVSGSDESGTG